MPRPPPLPAPHALNFAWLVKLRWASIGGQIATIVIASWVLGSPLPLSWLAAIVAVEIAANAAATVRALRGTIGERLVAASLAFDVLALSLLLYLSGGPFNPFSILYLVPIALGAVTVGARSVWALVVLALACSGVLFVDHVPLILPATHADHMRLHLQGMWVALGVAAAFVVWFLMRITRSLAAREIELAAARAQRDRVASLATLAAGAAHELATPLATIAVIARELERHLAAAEVSQDIAEDVRSIRSQVDRCRDILDRMSAHAGDGAGEDLVTVPAGALAADATRGLVEPPRLRVEVAAATGDLPLAVPRRALTQALRALVKNALDASSGAGRVELRVLADDARVRFEVRDEGPGMDAAVLARAGEPFFTTKPQGEGMGLGLFLTRAVAEQLGGELQLDSAPGRGTVATIALPRPARAGATR